MPSAAWLSCPAVFERIPALRELELQPLCRSRGATSHAPGAESRSPTLVLGPWDRPRATESASSDRPAPGRAERVRADWEKREPERVRNGLQRFRESSCQKARESTTASRIFQHPAPPPTDRRSAPRSTMERCLELVRQTRLRDDCTAVSPRVPAACSIQNPGPSAAFSFRTVTSRGR